MKLVLLLLFFITISGCATSNYESSRSIAQSQQTKKEYQNIDPKKVLFGVEYTFQDIDMVNEPGRSTNYTEHKHKKLEEFVDAYFNMIGIDRDSIVEDSFDEKDKPDSKPGYKFEVPRDGVYVINTEPVTIEFNTTPKTRSQVKRVNKDIFAAAKEVGLSPYINPAAERSGMGHIHVGGKSFGSSIFYQNPRLLRNVFVYFHKNPALLYGFAEAFDFGEDSNIETFHSKERQEGFKKAIEDYDEWLKLVDSGEANPDDAIEKFMQALHRNQPFTGEFLHHYRFINVEALALIIDEDISKRAKGKFTAEFRMFRPQKSSLHTDANLEMLLDIFERLNEEGHIEEFKEISETELERFFSASKIKSNWKEVKDYISHNNKYSDEMINELVDISLTKEIPQNNFSHNVKIYPAFSKKEEKGLHFEIAIEQSPKDRPEIKINNSTIELESIERDGRSFWVGYINTKRVNIDPKEINNGELSKYAQLKRIISTSPQISCNDAIRSLASP